MKGEFLSRRKGAFFGICGIVAGSIFAVRFGMFTVDAIEVADVFSAVLAAYGTLVGLIVGCCSLLYAMRCKASSLVISDDVLVAEYGLNKSLVLNLSDISGIAVNGLILTLAYGAGKRAVMPPMMNRYVVYKYLREHGVPAGLFNGDEDDALEKKLHRHKRRIIAFSILCIVMLVAAVALIVLTVVLTEGRDTVDFTTGDMVVFFVMLAVGTPMTVLTFVFADILGKSRVRGMEMFFEMASRNGRKHADEPSVTNYGQIINIRCFDEYRSRYVVFRVNDTDNTNEAETEKSEQYSFAVEIFYLKKMQWQTFGNYSFGEIYDTADEATAAAEHILGEVYYED